MSLLNDSSGCGASQRTDLLLAIVKWCLLLGAHPFSPPKDRDLARITAITIITIPTQNYQTNTFSNKPAEKK